MYLLIENDELKNIMIFGIKSAIVSTKRIINFWKPKWKPYSDKATDI